MTVGDNILANDKMILITNIEEIVMIIICIYVTFVIEQVSEFNAVANIEASRYDIETFSPDTKRQLKKVSSFLLK